MAVALYVDDKGPPPLELVYGWQAYDFHQLPCPGGLRDQPYNLLRCIRAAYNAWNAYREYIDNQLSAKWVEKNPEKWKVIVAMLELVAKYEIGEINSQIDTISLLDAWFNRIGKSE